MTDIFLFYRCEHGDHNDSPQYLDFKMLYGYDYWIFDFWFAIQYSQYIYYSSIFLHGDAQTYNIHKTTLDTNCKMMNGTR